MAIELLDSKNIIRFLFHVLSQSAYLFVAIIITVGPRWVSCFTGFVMTWVWTGYDWSIVKVK